MTEMERYLRFVHPRPQKGDSCMYDGRLHRYDGEAWYCVAERMAREAKERSISEKVTRTITLDQVLAQKKAADSMPTWSDIRDAFGQGAVDSGKVNLDLNTPDGARNRQLLSEMMAPGLRAEADRGEAFKMKMATLYDDANRPHEVPEASVEMVLQQGRLHDGKRAIAKEVP